MDGVSVKQLLKVDYKQKIVPVSGAIVSVIAINLLLAGSCGYGS